MNLSPFQIKDLPHPPALRKLVGPSFIILGLGLGSGEVILWPFLTSTYGFGIVWAAVVGITLQFFMNMEIERYSLVRGESVFAGFKRLVKWIPAWFLLSTFLPWIWPGIIASSAKLLSPVFGIANEHTHYLAIAQLIIIGLILSLGPVLYKTVETLQKWLVFIGVPSIFALAVYLAEPQDFSALAGGLVGRGDGYTFLPEGLVVASFLAALAYAGAGGNLNLAQSYFIREKGYGMGSYMGRITSLLTGKTEEVQISGVKFEITTENVSRFKIWWKNINLEHFFVFWLTGSITILLLCLLAYVTVFDAGIETSGINFLYVEADAIRAAVFPVAGTFFLLIGGVMLFSTQLGVFDATSRILSENVVLLGKNLTGKNLPKLYYTVLWVQIIAGIVIFMLGFTEPLQLLVLAAVLNAFAMFVHVGLTLWLNRGTLEPELKPRLWRVAVMVFAFLFYGGFSLYTILDKVFN